MPPVTVSEQYDAVLTTTLRNMQPTLRDNITRGNRLLAYMERQGRTRRVGGGERIKVPLMYGLNTGADIYSGYGIMQVTPQDGITSAFYPWAQLSVPITISGLEERQNRGAEAQLGLLQAKTMQAEASAMQLLNNCLTIGKLASGATGNLNQFIARTGALDTAASGPLPLPALIDANASRSVSIGSINGNTNAWWRNNARAFSGSTFAAYKAQKLRLYNDCSKGVMGRPDLIVSDQLVWELYFNSLQTQERYYITTPGVVDVLGGGSSEQILAFRAAAHIWDETVPDVGTSTATPETVVGLGDGVGTYLQSGAHGTEFHLNTQALEYIVHRDADMMTTPFVMPANQDARVAHIIWMGQLCVNNRRKLGVMYDIDNSIAA